MLIKRVESGHEIDRLKLLLLGGNFTDTAGADDASCSHTGNHLRSLGSSFYILRIDRGAPYRRG